MGKPGDGTIISLQDVAVTYDGERMNRHLRMWDAMDALYRILPSGWEKLRCKRVDTEASSLCHKISLREIRTLCGSASTIMACQGELTPSLTKSYVVDEFTKNVDREARDSLGKRCGSREA
eukprot:scaffold2646_cov42-Cyclotella_meneghiniana.AAC.10